MAQLLVLDTPPTVADTPDVLTRTGYSAVIATREGFELRLQLLPTSVAPVAVRPWVYRGGTWQPLRTDAAAGVGTEPVTADATKYSGFASGVYLSGPMAASCCLVLENGGDVDDVLRADLEEYFITT